MVSLRVGCFDSLCILRLCETTKYRCVYRRGNKRAQTFQRSTGLPLKTSSSPKLSCSSSACSRLGISRLQLWRVDLPCRVPSAAAQCHLSICFTIRHHRCINTPKSLIMVRFQNCEHLAQDPLKNISVVNTLVSSYTLYTSILAENTGSRLS